MGGHAKCLLVMTRGEGGGSKIPKNCLRNTWMFPKIKQTLHHLQPLQPFSLYKVSRSSKIYCCKSFEVGKLIHVSFLQFDEVGGATVIKYPYVIMSIQIEFNQKYQTLISTTL